MTTCCDLTLFFDCMRCLAHMRMHSEYMIASSEGNNGAINKVARSIYHINPRPDKLLVPAKPGTTLECIPSASSTCSFQYYSAGHSTSDKPYLPAQERTDPAKRARVCASEVEFTHHQTKCADESSLGSPSSTHMQSSLWLDAHLQSGVIQSNVHD